MSYSIVIPSKSPRNLTACITAIFERERALPPEKIIVVDDGAVAAAAAERIVLPPNVRYVPGERPFIFARNCNIGMRAAREDDVILLNDDAMLLSDGGFSLLAAECAAHPEYGIIGATTNVTGQPLQWRKHVGLREVPHFAFVCLCIPRRTIKRVGLLDERYCLDYGVEDRDYCEAVTRSGLKVGVHDGCFVDHGSLHSSFRGDPKQPKSYARNYELFRRKWGIR